MELVELCHCQYDAQSITEESFVCFPGSEEYVTFRAQLSSTAVADSTTLLTLIEAWVSTGPTIRVSGVLRRVDKDCSVAISDVSEGECIMQAIETPTQSVTDVTTANHASSQSDNTAAIVGAIAVVLIIAMTTAIIVVVALVIRYRHGTFNITKAEE